MPAPATQPAGLRQTLAELRQRSPAEPAGAAGVRRRTAAVGGGGRGRGVAGGADRPARAGATARRRGIGGTA
ncbi:hypothetical protein ABTD85_24070, partial [Acinetobacter baumannii]